jgi:2-desacetyl-2-hydroxyethyl bacteriochlorophyllide A dehydrogenase
MKAICLKTPRQFEMIDIAPPAAPGPGQALVRTHRMGICGTDYSGYLGKMPFFKYPRIPGHELGVEVIEVGAGAGHLQPGDRCSVEPYMNCGQCYACRQGSTNCCAALEVIGVMIDGGLCEHFLIRADKLHPSQQLSYEQLSLVETLAIGCHASDRADIRESAHVLVIGAGPIGLATLEFVRLTGAKITVMDMVESRLEFCRQNYGIESTICFGQGSEREQMRELTGGDLYAAVIDATGNSTSMSTAVQYVAPTGTLVFVGITTEELRFAHPVMHRPEATIKASRNALPDDFTRIIQLIEDQVIDTEPWITHRTTFDRVIDEFESFTHPDSGVIKAIIDVTA